MNFFRERPHWYMLIFHYGLGLVVAWQLFEDFNLDHWKIYSGLFYPWRQIENLSQFFGFYFYWSLAAAEIILLALYFLRVRLRWTAALLALVLFVDNFGSFLNHRLLMSIELFLVSLCPIPNHARGDRLREKQVYWNLDLVRWQISIVYLSTALHKMNAQFLSGETLQNLFWSIQHHGMKVYPDWLFSALQEPYLCMLLAWATVVLEIALAFGLNFRRTVGWCLPLALAMHVSFAALMAYIWIFTTQCFFALMAFLPDRVREGEPYRVIRAPGCGPHQLLRWLMPGYVELIQAQELDAGWVLVLPDGEELHGYEAWVELLSLSPATFLFAEIFRALQPLAKPRPLPAK